MSRALKFQKFRCGNLVTFYAESGKMNPVVLVQRGNYVVGACGGIMINSSTLGLANGRAAPGAGCIRNYSVRSLAACARPRCGQPNGVAFGRCVGW